MTTSNSSNKNGPSTLADRALKAWHERGMIFIRFASGYEVSFPTKGNPRLESAAEEDVGRIEMLSWLADRGPDGPPRQQNGFPIKKHRPQNDLRHSAA